MATENRSQKIDLSRQARASVFVCLLFLTVPTIVSAQTLNDRIMKYVTANSGNRIGGGECTDAVSEALRVSGAAFTESDLGEDYPEDGDRMWGTPLKVISFVKDKFIDSNPSTKLLPGDVLQYRRTTFVYTLVKGRKTSTRTVTADLHTSIVSKTDAKGALPIEVYEQNGPSGTDVAKRELSVSTIGLGSLRSGQVFVYRPKLRNSSAAKKIQISVVNNSPSAQLPEVKKGRKTVVDASLTPSNTDSSYSVLWFNKDSAADQFKLTLPSGASTVVTDGSGYEIYRKSSGAVAIRAVTP